MFQATEYVINDNRIGQHRITFPSLQIVLLDRNASAHSIDG